MAREGHEWFAKGLNGTRLGPASVEFSREMRGSEFRRNSATLVVVRWSEPLVRAFTRHGASLHRVPFLTDANGSRTVKIRFRGV